MKKVLNIIIILIVASLYVFVAMFIYNDFREKKRKEISNEIIDKVDDQIDLYKNEKQYPEEVEISYNGINYTALGKISIKKIDIYQAILKENTKGAYNTSVVKISGPLLNGYGNVAIGGHNYMKGNFFIKIKKLVVGDVVTVTDLSGTSVNYYVYEYNITSAEDVSYLLQPNDDSKIVTLVTCMPGGKERYYVKAKAR